MPSTLDLKPVPPGLSKTSKRILSECKELFTVVTQIESLGEPLASAVRQVRQSAADMWAGGDVGRVEVYIEGVPGGKVEVRVDGELVDTNSLLEAQGA